VKRYTRDGSIIVFHDSLKAEKNMKFALPRSIEWLQGKGYTFEVIPGMPKISRNREKIQKQENTVAVAASR